MDKQTQSSFYRRIPSCGYCVDSLRTIPEVPKQRGAPRKGREFFVWGTFLFLTKYGRKIKYVFCYELCLVDIFYLSLSTATGSELWQHVLSPAEVTKVRALCHIALFEFIWVEGGVKCEVHEIFSGSGAQAIKVCEPLDYTDFISVPQRCNGLRYIQYSLANHITNQ
jgi:hypothetical protein